MGSTPRCSAVFPEKTGFCEDLRLGHQDLQDLEANNKDLAGIKLFLSSL